MKYALERMDHLIRITLQPPIAGAEDIDPLRAGQWIEMTIQEKENVIGYLLHKALRCEGEDEFGTVVRRYQAMISQLMDFVYAQRGRGTSANFKKFIQKILEQLEELLMQIKERYHRYFDREARVPAPYLQKALQALRKELAAVQKTLDAVIGDNELMELLRREFNKLLFEERFWRYCDLSYFKTIGRELGRFQKVEKGSADEALCHLLLHLNFNSEAFLAYVINRIKQDVQAYASPGEQAKKLAVWFKQINQQPMNSYAGVNPAGSNARETISNWLTQEIYFLEQEQRPPAIAGLPGVGIPEGEVRLHFGVSVEVMTLLARAAKDSGLIVNDHLTEVFRILAQTCRTTYQEKPSAHSMLKKSYVAERNAKEAAIDFLHLMVKKVHGY